MEKLKNITKITVTFMIIYIVNIFIAVYVDGFTREVIIISLLKSIVTTAFILAVVFFSKRKK